jgi:hypothetical protein
MKKMPFLTLVKNLPILLKVMVTATSRIRALTTHTLKNPHFNPAGHHVGRAQMILGLLYKTKKKRALAVQHLTEAKRIIRSQYLIPWKSEICVAHHFHRATRQVVVSDISRRPGASHESDETEHLDWFH